MLYVETNQCFKDFKEKGRLAETVLPCKLAWPKKTRSGPPKKIFLKELWGSDLAMVAPPKAIFQSIDHSLRQTYKHEMKGFPFKAGSNVPTRFSLRCALPPSAVKQGPLIFPFKHHTSKRKVISNWLKADVQTGHNYICIYILCITRFWVPLSASLKEKPIGKQITDMEPCSSPLASRVLSFSAVLSPASSAEICTTSPDLGGRQRTATCTARPAERLALVVDEGGVGGALGWRHGHQGVLYMCMSLFMQVHARCIIH